MHIPVSGPYECKPWSLGEEPSSPPQITRKNVEMFPQRSSPGWHSETIPLRRLWLVFSVSMSLQNVHVGIDLRLMGPRAGAQATGGDSCDERRCVRWLA